MDRNTLLFVIIAALAGFIGGFLVANGINSSEINSLRSPAELRSATGLPNSAAPDQEQATLSEAEIQAKVDEAGKNAGNFTFQKELGISLYRYGAMKSDTNAIAESVPILTRANSLEPKDFDVLVSLGNALFDLGYANKDLASFQKARTTYGKALAIKPQDDDVKTDVGISYFVQEPADYAKAAAELEAVSKANPKHDRSMQFLTQVYIKQGRVADAERVLALIKRVNPTNPAIADLTSQIANAKAK